LGGGEFADNQLVVCDFGVDFGGHRLIFHQAGIDAINIWVIA
jgi:hypothetical protein